MDQKKEIFKMIASPHRNGKAIIQGKNGRGNPQFPGMQTGLNIDQVRALIKKQVRLKGYSIAVASGQTEFNLDLSGSARVFLGFAFLPPDPDDITSMPEKVSFNINEEIVIDQVHPDFFSGRFMDDEYYFIPRPLSGTDVLQLTWDNSNAAQNWRMVVYYL